MPRYEYECECGQSFDLKFGTFKEAEGFIDGANCPVCGGPARRVISPAAFHLHGSPEGWEKPSPAAKRVVNPDHPQFVNGPEKGKGIK